MRFETKSIILLWDGMRGEVRRCEVRNLRLNLRGAHIHDHRLVVVRVDVGVGVAIGVADPVIEGVLSPLCRMS